MQETHKDGSRVWFTDRCKGIDNPFIQLHNEIIEFGRLIGPTDAK